jgi:hypothetical protein
MSSPAITTAGAVLGFAFGLVLGLAPGLSAYADDVPTLRVEQVCRGIAGSGNDSLTAGDPDVTYKRCIEAEAADRETLKKEWSQFSAEDKRHCVTETQMGGEASYTELITCLEMARDARELKKNFPAGLSQSEATFRLTSPPIDTSIGQVPRLAIDEICHGIANQGADTLTAGDPSVSFQRCIDAESGDRDTLKKQWSDFSDNAKRHCVVETQMGGEASYTELLTCLEMARDVQQFRKAGQSDQGSASTSTSYQVTFPPIITDINSIPKLPVEQICKAVNDQGGYGLNAGDPKVSYQRCLDAEAQDRAALEKEWSQFTADDKRHCVVESQMGGESSYTELITCLEMARDVRQLRHPAANDTPSDQKKSN